MGCSALTIWARFTAGIAAGVCPSLAWAEAVSGHSYDDLFVGFFAVAAAIVLTLLAFTLWNRSRPTGRILLGVIAVLAAAYYLFRINSG